MNRIDAIRLSLPGSGAAAILITSPVNRLFATGFASSDGALLVTERDAWFFTDSRYEEAARSSVLNAEVRLVTRDDPYTGQIKAIIDGCGIDSVGFEDGAFTYPKYLEWNEKLETKLVPSQKLLDDLRAVKSVGDIAKMKEAQRIAEKSFEGILPLISTDITERQLAAELICRMLKNGADDKSFDPIVVSGEKTSMPHGTPEDRKIRNGFLTIDFGVKLDGWCSDTTRTLCVGKPDGEMAHVYETVLSIHVCFMRSLDAFRMCWCVNCEETLSARSFGIHNIVV